MICPACGGGPLCLLGVLGSLAWFRCRACGIDSHRPASTLEALEGDEE